MIKECTNSAQAHSLRKSNLRGSQFQRGHTPKWIQSLTKTCQSGKIPVPADQGELQELTNKSQESTELTNEKTLTQEEGQDEAFKMMRIMADGSGSASVRALPKAKMEKKKTEDCVHPYK